MEEFLLEFGELLNLYSVALEAPNGLRFSDYMEVITIEEEEIDSKTLREYSEKLRLTKVVR